MAPTPSPTLVHSSNSPSGRHLHHLRRQVLSSSHHPPEKSSASRIERFEPRTLDPGLQPSVVFEGPTPLPFAPTSSDSVVLASQPSAISDKDNALQSPNQPGDLPGNIVAAVVVIVLILGGLMGLVVGGEVLRRQAKSTGKRVSPPPSKCVGRRESKSMKNATGSPQQRIKMGREKVPYDEKTLTLLTRPPPVLDRERQWRFSDVWPIRSLSRALFSRRTCPEQVAHGRQHSAPVPSPQTTWSEFSPVTLYVPPARTVLARIPEEREEDCQSQTSEVGRSLECDSVVPGLAHDTFLEGSSGPGSSVTTERRDPQDCKIMYKAGMKDEDAKSLGSSAPDMTSDGGESSRSSTASLESLEDGHDRESLKEEVFELRRAQTRSMQMNKGVLLSLGLKTLPDHGHGGGCGPSTTHVAEGKDHGVERELSLAMLGGSFSAVNLDEFPSPPSILPMIPSFVSGF